MKLRRFGKTVWQNSFTNNFIHRWEREMREKAKISYFFSFIPTHVCVNGEEKQLHGRNYFVNKCLTNKTAHNSSWSCSACSLVSFWAGLDWLVLVCCERKILLTDWFGLAETNKLTGIWKYIACYSAWCLWLTSPLVVACFLDLKTEAGSTVWEPQHTISMCVRTWPSAHQAMLPYPIAEHTESSRRANYLFSPRE